MAFSSGSGGGPLSLSALGVVPLSIRGAVRSLPRNSSLGFHEMAAVFTNPDDTMERARPSSAIRRLQRR